MRLTFADGSVRELDLTPFLRGPLFKQIRQDATAFRQARVDPDTETLTWPNGADLDPDMLYHGGTPPWALPYLATTTEAISPPAGRHSAHIAPQRQPRERQRKRPTRRSK